MSSNRNQGKIFSGIIAFIGVLLLFAALLNVVNNTETQTDDLVVFILRIILNTVEIFTLPIPLTGGIGIVFTMAGTIGLKRS